MESYYSESEILTMLTHIRAEYFTEILEPTFRLDSLSTEGTIKDAIAEVRSKMQSLLFNLCVLYDFVYYILYVRKH